MYKLLKCILLHCILGITVCTYTTIGRLDVKTGKGVYTLHIGGFK